MPGYQKVSAGFINLYGGFENVSYGDKSVWGYRIYALAFLGSGFGTTQ